MHLMDRQGLLSSDPKTYSAISHARHENIWYAINDSFEPSDKAKCTSKCVHFYEKAHCRDDYVIFNTHVRDHAAQL